MQILETNDRYTHRERSPHTKLSGTEVMVQLFDSDHGRPSSQESEHFRHKVKVISVGFSVGDVDD